MEEALVQLLLADPALSALVGSRIHPGSLPQGSELPAVVLNRISGAPVYSDDGESGLTNARMQIDCWAETYIAAKQLARAAADRLSGFSGLVGTTRFQTILLETERDMRETGSNEPQYLYRTSLDFDVWFTA